MPRRSSGPRRRAASSSRSGSSSSGGSTKKPETTKQPAPTQQPSHAAHQPAPAPAAAPSGPGFLQRAAEIGTGIAIGHVAGRALENVFFGGREATPEQLEKAEAAAQRGPCGVQYKGFMRCLENNDEDAQKCDWAFDLFKECQSLNRSQSNQWGDDVNTKEQELSM